MERSKFLRLGARDFVNGLILAVLASVLLSLQQALNSGGLSIFTDTEGLLDIAKIALSTGLSYLLKNYFENSSGQFGRRES